IDRTAVCLKVNAYFTLPLIYILSSFISCGKLVWIFLQREKRCLPEGPFKPVASSRRGKASRYLPPPRFDRALMPSSYTMIVSLLTAVVALSASSLRTSEALMVVIMLSLVLWRELYLVSSCLAVAMLSQ